MSYSVVIPAFNAAATLGEALDSVRRQTVAAKEIIVVDDGSDDATADIARQAGEPVQLISQANTGPGGATTVGIGGARQPLIAFLDSDDLWLPRKMEVQLARLQAHPNCDGVFTYWQPFSTAGSRDDNASSPGWTRTTLTIRATSARRVGPIVDFPGGRGEMIDWIARAREIGLLFEMIDSVLALRRIRPGSLAYGRDPIRDRAYAKVAWLARQRRKTPRSQG